MDKNKIKLLIKEWVRIEEDLTLLKEKQREFNKKVKERKKELIEAQKKMEIPILQLMNEIDTESIKLTDNLDLKAKPVTKTHGVTKDHIKKRIVEYFEETNNSYTSLLSTFVQNNKKINVTYDEIVEFTKPYMKQNKNMYYTILYNFTEKYNLKKSDEELVTFINEHFDGEAMQIFNYIMDISARKEFKEEEHLGLAKRRGKKKKV